MIKTPCPKCGGNLYLEDKEIVCLQCGKRIEINRPTTFINELTRKTSKKHRGKYNKTKNHTDKLK
jgi:uncharacterized Zn finger protein (UPF0148 family)